MRKPKIVVPHWLPEAALAQPELLDAFEHVSRSECVRRAKAGLIEPATADGRVWRAVPRNRTDDSTGCRASLISIELSKMLRDTIVSQIVQRPLHEVDDVGDELRERRWP